MENELSIPVNLDTTQYNAKLAKAEELLKKFESATETVNKTMGNKWNQMAAGVAVYSTALKNVSGAINSYIIQPLAGAVNAFVQFGDNFSKTSQRIGIGVEALGGLKFAAEQCGSNFETLTDGVKTFQNILGAAQMGDTGALEKMRKSGLNVADFEGLSNEDQLMQLADHIAAIGDKSEQTRVAMELFGDAGFKLLPFFQEGSEGIQKLMAEGKDIGAVLGEEAVGGAVALADSMNRMKTSFSNVSHLIAAQLAPTLSNICDSFAKFVSGVTEWMAKNPVLTKLLGTLATGIGAVGAVLGTLLGIVPTVSAAFTALAANPATLWITGITAGVVAAATVFTMLRDQIRATEAAMYKLSDAYEKRRESVEKNIETDNKMFDRLKELEELSKTDTLNNSEVEEANRLIGTLNDQYGDLGVSIDATTGKIHGMTEAQKKMIDAQKRAQIEAAKAELAEIRSNQENIVNKYGNKKINAFQKGWEIAVHMTGNETGREKEQTKAMQSELVPINAKARAVYSRLAVLDPETYGEETEELEPGEKTLEELTAKSLEARAAQDAANKEQQIAQKATEDAQKAAEEEQKAEQQSAKEALATYKPDADLMSPLEKAFSDLAEKTAEKYKKLDDQIALAQKAGNTSMVSSLQGEYLKVAQWDSEQRQAIIDKETARTEGEAQKEYENWKAQNPDLVQLPSEDSRITDAKGNVESARSAHAQAVLNGGDVKAATEEMKQAELELAKAVATVSGEERGKAREELKALKTEYSQRKDAGAGNVELNALADRILEAQKLVDTKDSEYYSAVGKVESATPIENKVEEAAKEALQTSSRGTFSAWGIDSVLGADVPAQTLDQVKKICAAVIGLYENAQGATNIQLT